jgi:hypothetical protein
MRMPRASIGQHLNRVGFGRQASCRDNPNRRIKDSPDGESGMGHDCNGEQIAQLRIENCFPIAGHIPPKIILFFPRQSVPVPNHNPRNESFWNLRRVRRCKPSFIRSVMDHNHSRLSDDEMASIATAVLGDQRCIRKPQPVYLAPVLSESARVSDHWSDHQTKEHRSHPFSKISKKSRSHHGYIVRALVKPERCGCDTTSCVTTRSMRTDNPETNRMNSHPV